ncbi:carbohydrate ABC transporter permease [Paenibacillus apiarius]|uniref:Sugar ABC transporter permease n=1 Tax=Paenibacillus apiarius TaxID=46240 RepID=A0ABT4DUL5_9BACL|nr:sugar ABC transporter permease [Paenibacillus apiarius]MCY9514416.1 sugar ABC transporter permease [Paenibacillus apiarius]MCY9521046.1 sugar ABC transporter permease [Paenibacillus apiarius]MCY9551892.1 sugar ABC transporter permease [Paenibacillus apiarius]MCY9557780.1 sugar ABC transporter permease [Paenibacillus apiarius]MCY9684467.1 sugar ABC transporter permease [Paenibacillus apiarius]
MNSHSEQSYAVQPARLSAKRPWSWYRFFEKWKDFSFALPALLFLLVFTYYPLIYSIYISMTNWNMTRPIKKFVGMENYTKLLSGEELWKVLTVTFKYTVFDVFFTIVIGLGLALLFNSTSKIFNFLRAFVFMPYYISMVVAAMIFLWIFNAEYGLANYILQLAGFDPVAWMTNPNTALSALITVSLWKGVGFAMLLFIAGLRSIPVEYYEASSIDGATRWSQFRHITLPLLSPMTLFLIITNFIGSMQVFQSIDIMTNGGPLNATKAMVFWIYQMAFSDFRTGRASALVVIFFIIIITLTAIQLWISKKRVHYEG